MPKAKKSSATNDQERIDALAKAAESEEEGTETEEEENEEETQELEQESEENQETEEEEQEEELDEDGLPKDQKARSDLGRKLAALHRRQDEFDDKFGQLIDAMMQQNTNKDGNQDEIDPDEPLTRAQLLQVLEERESRKSQTEQQYNDKYLKAVAVQSADMEQDQIDAIIEEMKTITYTPSDNPQLDAEMNWLKAEKAYLRKVLASDDGELKNPLKGKKPKSALGVIKKQKTVEKESALPKLDEAAKGYLDFVKHRDGDEKAVKLHRSIARAE